MRISDQEANRLRLLKAIRRAEPVSRTHLVSLTGLAAGTVSEVTGDLVQRRIVLEEKGLAKGPGRPRVQMRLNPDAAYVVGVYLLFDGALEVAIANLRGDQIFVRSHTLSHAPTVAALATQIATRIDETIAAGPLGKESIHSVGIALPATIDSIDGDLHSLLTYPPGKIPFAAIVGAHLHLPVFIDNTANVVARSEHWFGEDRQLDDFCLVMVGLGLGFAQYVEGMLWTGPRGLNPELGHVKMVDEGGPPCPCGGAGCLTTYSTTYGVVSAISRQRGIEPPGFFDLGDSFDGFAAEARSGEPVARAAFDQAGRMLGVALANHANIWDPSRLIILCENATIVEMFKPSFDIALDEAVFPALRGRMSVEFRVEDEYRFSKGSAALVLEGLYRRT